MSDLDTRVVLFAVAAPFVLVGIMAAMHGVVSHLKDYVRPLLQRYEVRILLMIPIYIILTWLPLYYKAAIRYYRMGRDFFQGFFVGSFFQLLVEYLGGQEATLEAMSQKQPIDNGNCCWCLWKKKLTDFTEPDKIYLKLKRGAMQFTVVMPLIAIITMVLDYKNYYNSGDFDPAASYVWLQVTRLVSAVWSMLSLKEFLEIMEADLERRHVQAKQKFLCIQGVILGLLVQGIVISVIFSAADLNPDEVNGEYDAEDIQNFISIIEMTFVAFAHSVYFSHKEFAEDPGNRRSQFQNALKDSFIPADYFNELVYIFSKKPKSDLKKFNKSYGTLVSESEAARLNQEVDSSSNGNNVNSDLEANNHN